MPANHELQTVDAKLELVHLHLIHLRRWRNLVFAPLLRLPIELIHEIFVRAVKLSFHGGRFWVNLTGICHHIREALIYSPFPWRIINAKSIPLAKLFLERCNFDPRALFVMDRLFSPFSKATDKSQLWRELEGRTLNDLRFFMFRGLKDDFEHNVVDFLRRAPNLTTLEIETRSPMTWNLQWNIDDQLPHLTMLRLNQVGINWDAPILRNLTKLILTFSSVWSPQKFTSIPMFLSVLRNCPDLECLHLVCAGPDPESDAGDDSEIVQLHKLKELFLYSDERPVLQCILSYIWFPGSTNVQVEAECRSGPWATLSEILPPPNAAISKNLQKTTTIAIEFDSHSYQLATDNFRLLLHPEYEEDPQPPDPEIVPLFVSKVVDIIGRDTVIALCMKFALPCTITEGVWKELLHGFPRLKVISYDPSFEWGADYVDPFCSAFSQPFEGGLVCPRLCALRIPWSFTQGSSVVSLKQTLLARAACGRQLKKISFSRDMGRGEIALLQPFKDAADKISRFYVPTWRLLKPIPDSWPMRSYFFPDLSAQTDSDGTHLFLQS